jgi:iron complex outermembrane receptor protein
MHRHRQLSLRQALRLLMAGPALLPAAALAQQASNAPGDKLEEIIVTAERRTESLLATAISASVLSGELLADKGVTSLYDLQYAAPGVMISGFGSANVFNIRGIGRSQVDIDVPSGVVIYRDGAPTLAGYFQNEPYYDLDSIEVYRGPQGTFVGKSAAGGAVFIRTRDPELDSFSGSVEGNVGDYDLLEFTGIVNIPVSDTFALRLGYKHFERDHFYEAITGDYTGHPGEVDNNSFRLGALWQPNEQFEAVLKVDYNDLDFGGNPTTRYGEEPLGVVEQFADFRYTDESLRAVLALKYTTGGGTVLSSLTAYQDLDTVNNLDVNATDPLYYAFESKANVKIYSQEFNLISPEDQRVKWVTGLFLQRQEARIPSWRDGGFNFIGNGLPPEYPWATTPWDKNEDEWAVFAHLAFPLTDALELEAGARYSHYRMDQRTLWVLSFGGAPPDLGNPGVIPWVSADGDRQDLSEDSVDGQVALNWTLNDEHFLYGLISRGHITGGVNLFPPFSSYDEMQVINYETGWKATWADDRFRTQFTVYYESFQDYQANFADVSIGGINNPTNRNAETTSHLWGLELSGQARFGGFSLDFGAAYLDSELGTFEDVVDPFRTPPDNVVNLSGAEVPFAPNFTGNIGLSYAIPIADLYLTPRVDVSYSGETQAALWDTPLVTLESRTLVNGLLTLGPSSERWAAELWVTNAGDKHYVAGIQNNATLYYAAPPRQYGLRAKFNF